MQPQAKVYVVDDDEQARRSVVALVNSLGMECQAFSSAEEFLDRCQAEWTGCVVTDVRMPGMDGLKLQQEIRDRELLLPVIVLTAYAHVAMAVSAMEAGAITLIEKPYSQDQLEQAIRRAISAGARLQRTHVHRRQLSEQLHGLTPPERIVLDRLLEGKANKVIARDLMVSERTIEARRHAIFQKMGVRSVAELVRAAVEAGLLRESEGEHQEKP